MNHTFLIIVGAVVFAVGSWGALAWWRLVRNAAPYQDELGKPKNIQPNDAHEVIVVNHTDASGRKAS